MHSFMIPVGPMPSYRGEEGGPKPEYVPARAKMAMALLEMFTSKTASHPAISDVAVEIVPGQTLTEEEVAVQATACHVLNKYLAGKLPADQWEKPRLNSLRNRSRDKKNKGLIAIKCHICGGMGRGDNKVCPLCDGRGTLLLIDQGDTLPKEG